MFLNPSLFILPCSEIRNYGQDNLTYGSLSEKGLKTLIASIKKYTIGSIYGFDLGCGDGELIYNLQKEIGSWEGVEISDHRVSMKQRDVDIWQGDMLVENFRPYNVLHADNLCLDEITAEKLENKIALEFEGLYISYRYPESMNFLKKAIFLESIPTETTWTIHPIHFFRVSQ